MGSYATYTSLFTLIPGIPQTTTAGGYSVTVALISKHIDRAEALVNGMIGERYEVPFTTTSVPPMVSNLAEDISCYYVFRSLYSQDNQNYSNFLDQYKEAIGLLKEIRDGKTGLVDPNGDLIEEREIEDDTEISSNVSGRQSFFDIDTVTSYDFNNELEDEIRDKR